MHYKKLDLPTHLVALNLFSGAAVYSFRSKKNHKKWGMVSVNEIEGLQKDGPSPSDNKILGQVNYELDGKDSQLLLAADALSYGSVLVEEENISGSDPGPRVTNFSIHATRNPKGIVLVKGLGVHLMKVLLYIGQTVYHGILLLFAVLYNDVTSHGKNWIIIQYHFLLIVSWMLFVLVETLRHFSPEKRGGSAIQCLFAALSLAIGIVVFAQAKYTVWIDEGPIMNTELGSLYFTGMVLVIEIFSYFYYVDIREFKNYSEEYITNVWSYLHLTFLNRMIYAGKKILFTVDDLPVQVDSDRSYYIWQKALPLLYPRGVENPVSKQMYLSTIKLDTKRFIGSMLLFAINGIFRTLPALCLKAIVSYIESYDVEDSHFTQIPTNVIGYVVALFIFNVSLAYTYSFMFKFGRRHGIRVANALTSSIFHKSMILGIKDIDAGKLQTILSVDVYNIVQLFVVQGGFINCIIRIIVPVFFIIRYTKLAGLIGILYCVATVTITGFIAVRMSRIFKVLMDKRDERMKHVFEAIHGIRIIKFFAWEEYYLSKLFESRKMELVHLRPYVLLKGLYEFFGVSCTNIAAFICLLMYTKVFNHTLTISMGFTIMSMFDILYLPIIWLPQIYQTTLVAMESFKRIYSILSSEDMTTIKAYDAHYSKMKSADLVEGEVTIKNGSYSWKSLIGKGDDVILKGIDLHVYPRELVCVFGPIGAGKSSLLLAILNEMITIEGHLKLNGRIGYVSQRPWLQNATVRDNILFGCKWDPIRFQSVIEACSLALDLESFPAGYMTEIGEKGINVSGGQMQRISLARAVYNNADIYLLDDVLSAVDSDVQKDIFDKCIGPKGFLRDKTRILVTHVVSFCAKYADKIILLDKTGRIVKSGTYPDVTHGQENVLQTDEPKTMRKKSEATSEEGGQGKFTTDVDNNHIEDVNEEMGPLKTKYSERDEAGIVVDESRQIGGPSYLLLFDYCKYSGRWWAMPMWFTVLIVAKGFYVSLRFPFRAWLEDMNSYGEPSFGTSFFWFTAVLGLSVVFEAACNLVTVWVNVEASVNVYHSMLKSVLGSPVSWFDSNPVGRILNRFSADMLVIDTELIWNGRIFSMYLIIFFMIAASLLIAYPKIWIVVVPLSLAALYIAVLFIGPNRQLKCLESISRSPLYAYFLESLGGLTTIRAFKMEDEIISTGGKLNDTRWHTYFILWLTVMWAAVRLRLLCSSVYGLGAIYILLHLDSIGAGTAGLILQAMYFFQEALAWALRVASDFEMSLNAIERVNEYLHLDQEEKTAHHLLRPPPGWPSKGEIRVQNLSLQYPSRQEPALQNVSFRVPPGKRLGIVGRTGSGKSTLVNAIFRIVEPMPGSVLEIDGVDILSIGLQELRSHLAIIPQEPTLFCGTIRSQLDPLGERNGDGSLWQVLEFAGLSDFVKSLRGQLDHEVEFGGNNFSVGERQLFCMARALLHASSIIIMDEATASVDYETDAKIQNMIREKFQGTLLCVAHRLETVVDYDLVMVMDDGKVVEFDTPINLLKKRGGKFYRMAKATGEYEHLVDLVEMYQKTTYGNIVD